MVRTFWKNVFPNNGGPAKGVVEEPSPQEGKCDLQPRQYIGLNQIKALLSEIIWL